MPAAASNGSHTAPTKDSAPPPPASSSSASKKFELPVLDFHFSPLTEGTNIPPPEPEPTPVQEVPTPPETPKTEANKETKPNGHQSSPTSNANSSTAAAKPSHDEVPLSPTLSSRGSIRRLISKTLLNNQYANGETDGTHNGSPSRPESRATTVGNERKSRRASSFFGRFRSNNRANKRASIAVDSNEELPISPPKPKGPPPPMIPELSALKSNVDVADGGSLGSDLFKDIK